MTASGCNQLPAPAFASAAPHHTSNGMGAWKAHLLGLRVTASPLSVSSCYEPKVSRHRQLSALPETLLHNSSNTVGLHTAHLNTARRLTSIASQWHKQGRCHLVTSKRRTLTTSRGFTTSADTKLAPAAARKRA